MRIPTIATGSTSGARRGGSSANHAAPEPADPNGHAQHKVLAAAASRSGGTILPLPAGINLKGGALKATLASFVKRGPVPEKGKDRRPIITKAGRNVRRADGRGDAAEHHGLNGRDQTSFDNPAGD